MTFRAGLFVIMVTLISTYIVIFFALSKCPPRLCLLFIYYFYDKSLYKSCKKKKKTVVTLLFSFK